MWVGAGVGGAVGAGFGIPDTTVPAAPCGTSGSAVSQHVCGGETCHVQAMHSGVLMHRAQHALEVRRPSTGPIEVSAFAIPWLMIWKLDEHDVVVESVVEMNAAAVSISIRKDSRID